MPMLLFHHLIHAYRESSTEKPSIRKMRHQFEPKSTNTHAQTENMERKNYPHQHVALIQK